jgi:ATP-dependent DNA helicase RecG
MVAAVEQMRLSRSEHVDKPDPFVGAVLVSREGNELGRAHRANLRSGDHAEYTLLERKLRDKEVDGATLYVTLEPCAPSSRTPPKKGCAEWIVGARIAKVFIGIPDPYPSVSGRSVAYLLEHNVDVHYFPHDLRKEIEDFNKPFLDYCRSYRLAQDSLLPYAGPDLKEQEVVSNATTNDLSTEALEEYVQRLELAMRVPSDELWEFLLKCGLLSSVKDTLRPTLAGLVAFGTRPDILRPQCRVRVVRLKGTRAEGADEGQRVPDTEKILSGPLPHLIRQAMTWFTEHGPHVRRIIGAQSVVEPEYPEIAVREAVVNALVHRDYRGGRDVSVRIFTDQLVVTSPGKLRAPVTLAKVKAFTASSVRANERIAFVASSLGFMEEEGTGLRKIYDSVKAKGLKVEFEEVDDSFVVRMIGTGSTSLVSVRDKLDLLNVRQRRILSLAKRKKVVTAKESMKLLGVARDTVASDFRRLIELGFLERQGRGRAISYALKIDLPRSRARAQRKGIRRKQSKSRRKAKR